MELVYESFESKDSYNNVLTAIDTKWIEEALFKTKKSKYSTSSFTSRASRMAHHYDGVDA